MGVPVIASNLGGYTETVLEAETGFLVPPANATALAGAIERMIDLGAESRAMMGSRGRERVRRLYSKDALQSATLALYQRLLDETQSRRAGNSRRGEAVF